MARMKKKQIDPVVAEVKGMTDTELARWAKLGQAGFKQVAAELGLARRQYWRDFWVRGIVSWIALLLSIISLIVSLYRGVH